MDSGIQIRHTQSLLIRAANVENQLERHKNLNGDVVKLDKNTWLNEEKQKMKQDDSAYTGNIIKKIPENFKNKQSITSDNFVAYTTTLASKLLQWQTNSLNDSSGYAQPMRQRTHS